MIQTVNSQFFHKKAKIYLIFTGLFYLVSSFGGILISMAKIKDVSGEKIIEKYLFLYLQSEYLSYLSLITILIGILLLFRFNFARIAAIALAWWNIIAIFIVGIQVNIEITEYFIKEKKVWTNLWSGIGFCWLWIYSIFPILILTAIYLFIIHILKRSKIGCIFLKNKKG